MHYTIKTHYTTSTLRGWSGGAKVLGKLPVPGGGRVVRWCWVNFRCRGVLLVWIIVWQGLTALAVGAGGGCLDIFSLVYHFSLLSPSLWETARYRLKYCLKGPLSPKQPTNHPVPGRPTNLEYSRARAYCACSRCGWGLFGHFFSPLSLLFSFSLSLGDGPI